MRPQEDSKPLRIGLSAAIETLRSESWNQRVSAVQVLAGALHDRSIMSTLAGALDDADTAVTEEAVSALVVHGGTEGLRSVLAFLAVGDDQAGYHVRDKLVSLALAGFPLEAVLKSDSIQSASESVRSGANEVLSALGGIT